MKERTKTIVTLLTNGIGSSNDERKKYLLITG